MTIDPKRLALEADVEAARERVQRQIRNDPDHEVALAMYRADLRRARQALEDHDAEKPMPWAPVRRYVDGRRVEA